MANRLITIFGGSGFVGRHVVERLAHRGDRIRVAVRRPNLALFLKTMGDVGQIQIIQADLRHPDSVTAALTGADAAISAVGILVERRRQKFDEIHVAGARRIGEAARATGVKRLVHLSALGADPKSPSRYARSKAAGEQALRDACPEAVILRPSVIFGPEDDFFNRFATLARISPVMPLIGGGRTRFQPVYVGDVADAIIRTLDAPDAAGETFELGGPQVYSLREIFEYILAQIGRKRLLVPMPFWLARIDAALLQFAFKFLRPDPPLTVDQVRLLERDNVVSQTARGLADLGITPTPLEAIVPGYLWRFRRSGQFSDLAMP